MSTRRAAAVIAGLLLAVGLAVGLWPVSVADDIPCGSAFMPATRVAEARTLVDDLADKPGAADYTAMCGDALATRWWIALPVAGVAAIGGLFLILTNVRSDEGSASRSPQAR